MMIGSYNECGWGSPGAAPASPTARPMKRRAPASSSSSSPCCPVSSMLLGIGGVPASPQMSFLVD
eukprot:scaffold16232_cov126-Isochrysis_galbana.AAC.9